LAAQHILLKNQAPILHRFSYKLNTVQKISYSFLQLQYLRVTIAGKTDSLKGFGDLEAGFTTL